MLKIKVNNMQESIDQLVDGLVDDMINQESDEMVALLAFFKKLKKQIDDSDHVFVETIRFLSMLKIWYLLRYIYLNKVYYFIFKLCKLLLEMVIKLLPKIKKKLIIEHKRLCNDFIVKRYNFLLNIADKSKFNYNKKRC